jgi:hypothetical protein
MRLALLAIGLVGVVVLASLTVFTTALPDENAKAPSSIGYVDLTVDMRHEFTDGCVIVNDVITGCHLRPAGGSVLTADEHLTLPTATATIFELPRATITTRCRTDIEMTVAGPGLDAPVKIQSNERQFDVGDTVTYSWGHLYLSKQGLHTAHLDVFVYGCFSYVTRTNIGSHDKQFFFDGEPDR